MRKITNYESDLVSHICGIEFIQEHYAVEDIHPEDRDWHHIRFLYASRPWPDKGYTVLADLIAGDTDGEAISLLALGDGDGRLYEIEIQRLDGQPIQSLPLAKQWVNQRTEK